VYQQLRLYEFSPSMKLLLTGFIVAVCLSLALALAAAYHVIQNADGEPGVQFRDIEMLVCGTDLSVLERAASEPDRYGLATAKAEDLTELKEWCQAGASRERLERVRQILKDSSFDRRPGQDDESRRDTKRLNREYRRLASLATCHERLQVSGLAMGTALYLSVVGLAFLGLGLMFVRTSLFEKTKIFFVTSTFLMLIAVPACLWLARRHPPFLYPMLLGALLLGLGLSVFALVALFDIWFRRPVT